MRVGGKQFLRFRKLRLRRLKQIKCVGIYQMVQRLKCVTREKRRWREYFWGETNSKMNAA